MAKLGYASSKKLLEGARYITDEHRIRLARQNEWIDEEHEKAMLDSVAKVRKQYQTGEVFSKSLEDLEFSMRLMHAQNGDEETATKYHQAWDKVIEGAREMGRHVKQDELDEQAILEVAWETKNAKQELAALLAAKAAAGTAKGDDANVASKNGRIVKPTWADLQVKRHEGGDILLPIPMPVDTAIEELTRISNEGKKIVEVHVEFSGHPLEVAVAFYEAMKKQFGWVTQKANWGTPPETINVPIDHTGRTVNIPIGKMELPGIEGWVSADIITPRNKLPKFVLNGQIPKHSEFVVNELARLTNEQLKHQSIYRGKAVRVSFEWLRQQQKYDIIKNAPQFMDVEHVDEGSLILPDEVYGSVETALFNHIELAKELRKNKIPAKWSVLLGGREGTGKTLTALIAAKKSLRMGRTYLYLESALDLELGLEMVLDGTLGPVTMFVEDIDRTMAGERTIDLDTLLNLMDGVRTKTLELITVMSTNNVDVLSKVVIRRFNRYVKFLLPDAKAATRLIMQYGGAVLDAKANFAPAGERLAGLNPSFISAVVQNSKAAAIGRLRSGDVDGKVGPADIIQTFVDMRDQADLLTEGNAFAPTNVNLVLDAGSLNALAKARLGRRPRVMQHRVAVPVEADPEESDDENDGDDDDDE